MSELNEFLYGKEYAETYDKFSEEINALDQKYPGILKEGDSFGNHYVMTSNILPQKVTFKVQDPTDTVPVPDKIRDEMNDIFSKYFKPKDNPS